MFRRDNTLEDTMRDVRAAYDALLKTCDSNGLIGAASSIDVIKAALGCTRSYASQLSIALGEKLGLRRRSPHKRDCWLLLPWNVSEADLKELHHSRSTSFMRAEGERQQIEQAALGRSYVWVYQNVLPGSIWTYVRPNKTLVTFTVGKVKPDARYRSAGGTRLRVHLIKAISFEPELLPTHIEVEAAATLKEIAGHAFYLLATTVPVRLKPLGRGK